MAAKTRSRPGYGTAKQVAEYTGYSVGTLANWRSQGRTDLPWTSSGRGRGHKALYLWADVDAFMQANARTRTA